VNEYLWQIVEADRPLAKMTSIIDLQGLNLSVLRQGDIIGFLKIFVQTMDSHFPQRANRTLLINAPKWFNMLYKLLSPLLRESTKEKIKIYSNGIEQDNALLEVIQPENIESTPKSFWSSSQISISKNIRYEGETRGESKETMSVSDLEHELRVFVSISSNETT
jgi:CRAL/TRIO domain